MKILFTLLALISSNGFAGSHSAIEPLTSWSKKSITVCFGTQADVVRTALSWKLQKMIPYMQAQKNFLKEVINQEFTPELTGIHFIGWDDCTPEVKPDAIIFREENESSSGGQASMGYHGIHNDNNEYRSMNQSRLDELGWSTFVRLTTGLDTKKLSEDERLAYIALHEFGHLAGLRHEHIREEAKNDWICKITGHDGGYEPIMTSTRFTSGYDSFSIMSYCFNTFMANYTGMLFDENIFQPLSGFDPQRMLRLEDGQISLKIGLSTLDQHALRCMYSYSPELKSAICHDSYKP